MAIYPKAKLRLIAKHNTRSVAPGGIKRVNLHVAVSETSSLYGFFSRAGVCSHFYITKAGVVEQYIDTKFASAADLDGNRTTISVETQGGLKNAQGEPWTEAQIEALAELYAWAAKTHGLPLKLATSSIPGATSHGLSYHRLGVDPWRKPAGMYYSRAYGKICPGDKKISQIPTVLERAKSLSNASKPSTPEKPAKPAAKPSKPAPKPSKPAAKLAVDGFFGPATVRALQAELGTTVDGVFSSQVKGSWNRELKSAQWVPASQARGSLAVKALQKRLGVTQDGLFGPQTIRALQKKLGTPADGVISAPSTMVKALQRNLNQGKLF